MSPRKRTSGTAIALWVVGGMLAIPVLPAPPALADIYQWNDESGLHFTDDLSKVPAKYRGKAREIQKTPPEAGKPSLSTLGAPPPSTGPSFSPGPPTREEPASPPIPVDDDATQAEKLRAKIDAKETFLRGIDEKRSLAINPYRNRIVSPSDMELYQKYKEELPADREQLKALESRQSPVRRP